MTIDKEFICVNCVHFRSVICPAFPEGIPETILTGENDHSKPLPEQDNDIVFEPQTPNNKPQSTSSTL
jgi:hypothetical protein